MKTKPLISTPLPAEAQRRPVTKEEFEEAKRSLLRRVHTLETQPKDYIDFAPYNMPVAERRKLNVGDIYINQVRCKKCGWYIRSKNQHHRATCKCGAVSIDGGSWYSKISGDPADVEMHVLSYKHIEPSPETP